MDLGAGGGSVIIPPPVRKAGSVCRFQADCLLRTDAFSCPAARSNVQVRCAAWNLAGGTGLGEAFAVHAVVPRA